MKSIKCKKCGRFFNPIHELDICCSEKCFNDNVGPGRFNYCTDENLVDSVEQKSVVCKIVKPKFLQRIKWAFRMLVGLDCVLVENEGNNNEKN